MGSWLRRQQLKMLRSIRLRGARLLLLLSLALQLSAFLESTNSCAHPLKPNS